LLYLASGIQSKGYKPMHGLEAAKRFVENLGWHSRIAIAPRVDSETGSVKEFYILYGPFVELEPIFKSGDCAAVRQAIESGLLELIGGVLTKDGNTRIRKLCSQPESERQRA
jgi:hypothetical protein